MTRSHLLSFLSFFLFPFPRNDDGDDDLKSLGKLSYQWPNRESHSQTRNPTNYNIILEPQNPPTYVFSPHKICQSADLK